jgi:hypothetical protein
MSEYDCYGREHTIRQKRKTTSSVNRTLWTDGHPQTADVSIRKRPSILHDILGSDVCLASCCMDATDRYEVL